MIKDDPPVEILDLPDEVVEPFWHVDPTPNLLAHVKDIVTVKYGLIEKRFIFVCREQIRRIFLALQSDLNINGPFAEVR